MPHLLERRDPLGNSAAVWILAALLFLVPLAWWSLRQLRLENDITTWLPPDDPELQVLNWAHRLFPNEDRLIITWEGSALGDPRIDDLRKRLEPVPDKDGVRRGGLPYIDDVLEPRELLIRMRENKVPPQEAARRLTGLMLGHGPLRVRLTERGRGRSRHWRAELPEIAERDLGLKLFVHDPEPDLATTAQIPGFTSAADEAIPAAPPAILLPNGELDDSTDVEHDLALSWQGMRVGTPQTLRVVEWLSNYRDFHGGGGAGAPLVERCFFVAGAPAALAVTLSEAGQADLKETLRQIRQAARQAGIPEHALKLGGSAVVSSELNREVAHAAWDVHHPITRLPRRSVILTSVLVGAVLALVMVRDVRLAAIVLGASLLSTYLAVALVPVTGGSMNLVLVVMPTLLMVITLSASIHVANYWRHAAAVEPHAAAVEAARRAFLPCLLAAVTTAIGLASLCTSRLSPVREFGLYAALGTGLSFFVAAYAVPSLLMLWRGKAPALAELDHPGWRWLGGRLVEHPAAGAAVFLGICAACSWGLTRFQTETKVIRFFGDTSRIVQDYWYLENRLAGVIPVETIVRFDAAAQDETCFLDRMELVRTVTEHLRQHPEISGCLALPDFQPVSEGPEASSMLARSKYYRRASILQDRVRSGEIPGVEAFYTVAGQHADAVHPQDHAWSEAGDELWRITAQVNVMTDASYAAILDDIHRAAQEVLRLQPGARHVVTGTVPLFLQTQQAVLNSLISSSLVALGLILAVLVIQLRSLWAALVALIPNVLPITVVFGCISYWGLRVDIGTMITASIALGMSVDSTLHMLTWFRRRLAEGVERRQAVIETLVHCGPAVWQTSCAVALGLLMLVPAELQLISRFGWLMAAMVGTALLGDLVLLPQLLASPLGQLFVPVITPPVVGDTAAPRVELADTLPSEREAA
jgi:predicted RND superfamily exporter protein